MVGRILRKGFNYICLSTNISIPYTKVEVCTGPYPADERGVFQWGGPGWQMRGGFSNSPGRAGKSLMSFKTPGLVSYEAQQKTLLSNPCRKIYCLLLLLLLLLLFLLLLLSQSSSSLLFSLLGLTHTFRDRHSMLTFRWKVVLNECKVL